VADSNGLNDIDQVYFITTKPDNTSSGTPFFMYDDGGAVIRDGVTSGDIVAGDGIYSLTIQVPETADRGAWLFTFFVIDKALNMASYEKPIEIY